MRRTRRGLAPALAVLAGLALAALPAQATTYVPMSDHALAQQAPVVVEGVVTAAAGAALGGGLPATEYTVEVQRVLKGDVPGGTIVVRVPGGVDPNTGIGLRIWGAPHFARNETTLLFLRPHADGSYGILHLMLGAFHARILAGRVVALRDLSEARALKRGGAAGRDGSLEPVRDFAAFEQAIEQGDATAPDAYSLDHAAADLSSVSSGYTFLLPDDGVPIRWFRFDQGQSVELRVHSGGQPGLGESATVAAFRTALQAWDDDPATNVAYVYGGLTGAGGGLAHSDGTNAILFDDPYRNDPVNAVEGSFSCARGGVIAMGGPFFDSRIKSYGGQRYHEAVEADIVTNDGTDCFFQNDPKVAEEVFAHELGHTLGLGHSKDGNALMYANAHDDGRGALLTGDDRAALAVLYGHGATSGGGSGNTGGGSAHLAAPRRLGGRATSATTAKLFWRDKARGEAQYVVQVSTRRRNGFHDLVTVPANSTGADVGGLRPHTRYFFRVVARSGGASSPPSNLVTITTPRR